MEIPCNEDLFLQKCSAVTTTQRIDFSFVLNTSFRTITPSQWIKICLTKMLHISCHTFLSPFISKAATFQARQGFYSIKNNISNSLDSQKQFRQLSTGSIKWKGLCFVPFVHKFIKIIVDKQTYCFRQWKSLFVEIKMAFSAAVAVLTSYVTG